MRRKSQFQIDQKVEKTEANIKDLYVKPNRTPEFYYEAGKKWKKQIEICKESKWSQTIEDIREAYKKHMNNLTKLEMYEHAESLKRGYQGE